MRPRTKMEVAALALLALAHASAAAAAARKPAKAPAAAAARKPAKAPPPPNADQQDVVAAIVNDTFPLPKRAALPLALCLDVRVEAALNEDGEDAAPPAPPRRGVGRKRPRAPEPPALLPVVRGAPVELVARLARPWRVVSSALACRLEPRMPYALGDAAHTPAQLVTVHLAPDTASGTIKIDWSTASDPTVGSSRDCTAARGPRGWTVHCGGTWFQ